MSAQTTKLYLVCGKIAAGKSTLCRTLSKRSNTVLLSEDKWLSVLFSTEMNSISDYLIYAGKLRGVIGPHVVSLLRAGMSVVMDFPANTSENRLWLSNLADQAGVAHELHFLDVPETVCKDRLHRRNSSGEHPFAVSDEQFERISGHFVRPTEAEGLCIVLHDL